MFDLVVIGHLLKERIVFSDGKEIGPVLGSPAAYASVAAARLGLKVGLVTKIGEDMPKELLKVFEEVGVDTDGIRIDGSTTANLLVYEKSGKKRLEFLNKADDISFEDVPEKYLNTHFFLIAPIDYEVQESLIEHLYQKGKKLSMELSGFGGASSHENGKTRDEKIEFLQNITQYFAIVKGGEEDYRCLFDGGEIRESGHRFIDWGTEISIVTRGAKEASVITDEDILEIPVFPTDVVDCTGAGDAWHSGFLCEYLRTKDLRRAGNFASALSSLLIERTGGVKSERFSTSEEVMQRIRSGEHGFPEKRMRNYTQSRGGEKRNE